VKAFLVFTTNKDFIKIFLKFLLCWAVMVMDVIEVKDAMQT
jgi:hypothetical protein